MKLTKSFSDERTALFTKNYDSYYTLIFSSILKKIGKFHVAEDLCQEIFIRYYNKIDEIENTRKWLFGTLRLVLFDYYREKDKTKNEVEYNFDDVSMGYVNGFKDTRLMLEEVMEEVHSPDDDENDRTIFELVAVNNFSYTQVSRDLNMTYRKVRYRFERVTKKILDQLKKKGINCLEDLL